MDKNEEELNDIINRIKTCPNCKAVVNGDKFCHNCGKEINEEIDTKDIEQNDTTPDIELREEPKPLYRLWGAIIGTLLLSYLLTYTIDYGNMEAFLGYMIGLGWIGGVIGYYLGNCIDKSIMQTYLQEKTEYLKKKQEKEEEIKRKKYEEEHSPENEKKKRDKELQESIDRITPFTNLEDAKDYHIKSIAYEQNEDDSLKEINVILENSSRTKMKNLVYVYKGKNITVEVPIGATASSILQIKRKQIYNLIEDGDYEKAYELFKEVFKKDPFTGEDIK